MFRGHFLIVLWNVASLSRVQGYRWPNRFLITTFDSLNDCSNWINPDDQHWSNGDCASIDGGAGAVDVGMLQPSCKVQVYTTGGCLSGYELKTVKGDDLGGTSWCVSGEDKFYSIAITGCSYGTHGPESSSSSAAVPGATDSAGGSGISGSSSASIGRRRGSLTTGALVAAILFPILGVVVIAVATYVRRRRKEKREHTLSQQT